MSYGKVNTSNPFELGDEYEVNQQYEPPEVSAVVPAVPVNRGATAAAAAAAHPAATISAVPLVPEGPAAPVIQFTESNLSTNQTTGNIGQGAAARDTASLLTGHPSSSAPVGGAGGPDDPSSYALWNLRRYRPYFDVDTKDVLWRVGSSFLGPFKPDFMEVTMSNPDMYGPFWVATTLIFVTAVAGNYADFLAWRLAGQPAPAPLPPGSAASGGSMPSRQWYTDYAKVSFSALLFYGYVFVFGLALYFALRWFNGAIKLVNVWCIYGYSLTIFIPVSFVCIVPLSLVRWLAVMAATAVSGLFIVANLKATIFEVAPARASLLLALLLAAHVGVGLALRLYFFRFTAHQPEA